MISGTTRIDGRRYDRTDPMPENSPAGKRNRQRIRADSLCQSRMPSFLFDERFQYGQFAVSCPHFLVEFHEFSLDAIDACRNTTMGSVAVCSDTFDLPVQSPPHRTCRRQDRNNVPVFHRSGPFLCRLCRDRNRTEQQNDHSTSTTLNRVFLFPVPSCSRSVVYRFSFRIGKPPRPQRAEPRREEPRRCTRTAAARRRTRARPGSCSNPTTGPGRSNRSPGSSTRDRRGPRPGSSPATGAPRGDGIMPWYTVRVSGEWGARRATAPRAEPLAGGPRLGRDCQSPRAVVESGQAVRLKG